MPFTGAGHPPQAGRHPDPLQLQRFYSLADLLAARLLGQGSRSGNSSTNSSPAEAAGHQIPLAGKIATHRLQHPVPGLVTVAIVDLLEVVEIQHHQRPCLAIVTQ